ncbi:MAG: potassium channel family protein [Methanobacteriaceae archaeon]|nr:potassium channel family protein [Methanobacteriaceae archaeon]
MSSMWMKTSRIETLVDGIFAISMTLLVLTLDIPNIPRSLSEIAFQQQLGVLWPQLLCYFLSFWILGGLWRVNHQQFNFIKRANPTLITINIFCLILIAMIPFSTEMVSTYGISYFTANIIFQANQLLAGILYYINWEYALWNHLADVDERTSRFIKDTSLVLPICSIIAMSLSFYMYAWSNLIYLTIPAFKKVLERKYFPKTT